MTLTTDSAALDKVLCDGLVHSAYQPIVDLRTRDIVAFEALARGDAGCGLESPADLFRAAAVCDRLVELDRLCSRRAIEGAMAVHPRQWVFVNVEPDAAPAHLADLRTARASDAAEHPRIMVELTERALTARPAELLALVRLVRSKGWGVALDDVGADPRSLALMHLLDPDVIKLDLSLVQENPSAGVAEIVAAVSAYAEQSAAVVLAEGLETDDHIRTALAMGATYGQGWRFGRPGPLPQPRRPATELILTRSLDRPAASPLAAIAGGSRLLTSTKPLLIEMSRHLEQQALQIGPTAVVLAAFQRAEYFTPRTAEMYQRLAARSALVGALGVGMPAVPADGVRGAHLDEHDPIRQEWDIAVVSPHFAAALVAKDVGDTGPEDRRRFEYVLTYDRRKATAVARSLMERFVP